MLQEINLDESISRWKSESILNIAHHFHKFDSVQAQYSRLGHFKMIESDLQLFNEKLSNPPLLQKIEIHLGLNGDSMDKYFTAFLILKLIDTEHNVLNLHLTPKERVEHPSEHSDLVPKIFKETISKNWDEIDFHLIDDLFVAKKATNLVRVHHFIVGDKMVDFINNGLSNYSNKIKNIRIYAGVDLNKFSDKSTISFTPVIGFEMPNNIRSKTISNGFYESTDQEIFIEYSMPCPPTCRDEDIIV